MRSTTTASLLLLAAPAMVTATSYNLAKEYSGTSFFDEWNFYGNCEQSYLRLVTILLQLDLVA